VAIDGVSIHVRIVGVIFLFYFILFIYLFFLSCLVQKVHVEIHIDAACTNLIVLANE